MLTIFDGLRDFSILSITARMVLAVICSGAIGIERTFKHRPAGFRTHILICLGTTMTTLTSQFLCLEMHYYTDMARLGAQVVAGIGFIGAGTIIVTRRQRVKGLTTAAGLWAVAIIGLSFGCGFYEGALCTTLLVLFAELVFSKIEYKMMRFSPEVMLYVEYRDRSSLDEMLRLFRTRNFKVLQLELSKSADQDGGCINALIQLRLNKTCTPEELVSAIKAVSGVTSVTAL